ncbi:replication initiation negative regulator SeqA [Aestuariibacter halophilus]|uniref:Negative modulator of initiation of replication n=1 Tax=Fluctibacter halophilus TaxID=226011 RepID=A0ABS8G861_9ALTE|nr:replication initiation negative regulator SeqA [Aestuariibacter halophilus]MCC2616005.1 replication initiation negative regulator SeqA [Aestuariibacter halophilus]
MKHIEIDDQLYAYIASQTQHIGESASQILRRLLLGDENAEVPAVEASDAQPETTAQTSSPAVTTASHKAPVAPVEGEGVFAILNAHQDQEPQSRVEHFLQILAALHQAHPERFDNVLSVKGRNRLYFATSKEALLESGSSTNPKQVPGTHYWVVTNNNTAKKVAMLNEVAEALGYPQSDAQRLTALFAA